MKKIINNITKLCLIIVFVMIFTLTLIKTNDNTVYAKTIWDGTSTVDVKNDDGTTVTYWKQTETVKRASSYSYPLQSLRATWASQFIGSIPNYSTESAWKADVKTMLDRLEEYGLNCVVFHVRTHNNACYKTELAPVATFMAKADFDTFDPITYLVEECHKRSIEFHAWLNPYRINDSYCAEAYPAANPASNSANILSNGSGKILNPAIPEVQDYLVNVCRELAENYDIDAIHFDDYFYISDIDDSATRKIYNTKNLSIDNFRRQAVDSFIEKLSKSIKEYNQLNQKTVSIGISPPGGYQNNSKTGTSFPSSPTYNADGSLKSPIGSNTSCFCSYGNYLYADTLKWINNEWIDYIMPQTYWALNHPGASYADLSRWWSWAVRNRKVNLYTGIGYYMSGGSGTSTTHWQKNVNQVRDILLVAQTHEEIGGVCFYSYNYLNHSNTIIKTGMELIKNDYYQTKIPGDVKQSYAGVYPTPDAENVTYDSSTISWSRGTNLRGYLIFKVEKGQTLNLKNDTQVVYYGNDTAFKTTDINATYYISTVNLANEISTPKVVSLFEKTPAKIIEYINNIPSKTSSNYNLYLEQLTTVYNSLSESDKLKVTNRNVLLGVIELNKTINEYTDKVKNYCKTSEYSKEKQALIKTAMNTCLSNIDKATTTSKIIELYNEYTKLIDSYEKASVELKTPKEQVTLSIEEYYQNLNKDLYLPDNQTVLLNILNEGRNNIKNSNSLNEINGYKQKYIDKFNAVTSIEKEYLEKLETIKASLKETAEYYNDRSFYEVYESKINSLLEEYYQKLQQEKPLDVYNNTLDISTKYENDLNNAIYPALWELYRDYTAIVNSLELYDKDVEGLAELKGITLSKLYKCNTTEELNTVFDEFKTSYDNLGNKQNPVSGCISLNIIYLLTSISLIFVFKKK